MAVKKIGKKWCVVHGTKKGMIGKPLKGGCHSTYRKAKVQHTAILLSKLRKEGRIPPRKHNPNGLVGAMLGGAIGAFLGYKIGKKSSK